MTISINKLIIGFTLLIFVVSVGLGTRLLSTPAGTGGGSSSHSGLQVQAIQDQDPEKIQTAPAFTLESLDGGNISLADYKGEKAVVLDFWASWCHNCRRDMPKMNAMYPKFKDEVEVIAINLQESKGTAAKFVESQGFDFPVVLDPSGRTSQAYGVTYTNTHVLIDKDGNIVTVIPGDITEEAFQALIET